MIQTAQKDKIKPKKGILLKLKGFAHIYETKEKNLSVNILEEPLILNQSKLYKLENCSISYLLNLSGLAENSSCYSIKS